MIKIYIEAIKILKKSLSVDQQIYFHNNQPIMIIKALKLSILCLVIL